MARHLDALSLFRHAERIIRVCHGERYQMPPFWYRGFRGWRHTGVSCPEIATRAASTNCQNIENQEVSACSGTRYNVRRQYEGGRTTREDVV